ncbi:uncharacterized protein LOC144952684 [Lampetra fluviatilis]
MTCYLPGLLLVALMFVSGGHSLKCYECETNTDNAACNENGPATCHYTSQDNCLTIHVYKGSKYSVTKECATKDECDTTKVYVLGATTSVTCCQSDGCNVNVAPRPLGAAHVTLALMGVATSVVVGRALA